MTSMNNRLKQIDPWYQEGLHFECTGCGQCCTGAPGYIWVNDDEIRSIATHLNLELQEFADRYLRKIDGRFSLREDPTNFDCAFLIDNKCSIYSHRPTQCRTFPWWPTLLKTRQDWEEASHRCEGITKCAPLVPFDKIQEQLTLQLAEKPLEH